MIPALAVLVAADCLHDGDRHGRREETPEGVKTWVWCARCEALLLTTDGACTVVNDEVHRLLYTRDGRRDLLVELLMSHGVMPSRWGLL